MFDAIYKSYCKGHAYLAETQSSHSFLSALPRSYCPVSQWEKNAALEKSSGRQRGVMEKAMHSEAWGLDCGFRAYKLWFFNRLHSLSLSVLLWNIRTVIPISGFPGGSVVANPPLNSGNADWSLGGRSLEEEMATHSSILAWGIPWTEGPGRLQSMGSQKSWTRLSN